MKRKSKKKGAVSETRDIQSTMCTTILCKQNQTKTNKKNRGFHTNKNKRWPLNIFFKKEKSRQYLEGN